MRIAYVNKADNASLTASSEAGGLIVGNLKTVYKSEVWRSTGTTATLRMTWGSAVQCAVISMPFTNLSSSATVRIRAYINSSDVVPYYDSGVVLAVPPIALTVWPWGSVPLGVNSFAFGNISSLTKWIPVNNYQKIILDIDDSFNPSGYIESGRLFVSNYYEFINNADFGAEIGLADNSSSYRNDASDLLTERGITYKTMKLSLSNMRDADRTFVSNIFKMSSANYPVLVSIFPENANALLEQEYQIFGKLSKTSSISIANIDKYASSIELESV